MGGQYLGAGHVLENLSSMNTRKKTRNIKLFIFVYSIAFISFISTLRLVWYSYRSNKVLLYLGVLALALLIACFAYVSYKLKAALKKAEEKNDEEMLKYITEKHIICANPLCQRCSGYYTSFLIVFASILTNSSFWAQIAEKIGKTPNFLMGFIIMLLTVPVHGTLTRLTGKYTHPLLKFVLGFLFGISLALISGSIVLWIGLKSL